MSTAKRTRFLGVSKSGGAATWLRPPSAAASKRCGNGHFMIISKLGDANSGVEVASYTIEDDHLQDEISTLDLELPPQKIAVHPGGDVLCTNSDGSCRLMEADYQCSGGVELRRSDKELPTLQNIGPQNCVMFSIDGSQVALGGKDGYLRVFEWPSLKVVIDEPRAHKSIKDLDFSLDGGMLASTSKDGPCRVWDLHKGTSLASLHHNKDEKFGFCRFSKNGAHPFLFVTVNKDGKGFLGVWEIAQWTRLGVKEFHQDQISAFAMSCDGKRLALGTNKGGLAIIEVNKMVLRHQVKGAHISDVTCVEFSPDSRALLSTSSDANVRVTATNVAAEWKEWQVYLLLVALILMSALLFYFFFEYSDSFWNFPLGRNQPAPKTRLGAFLREEDASGW